MQTGLICKNNQASFIKTIGKLIDMKDLQTDLGSKGRKKILELGSRKENMMKFVQLMERLKDENTQN